MIKKFEYFQYIFYVTKGTDFTTSRSSLHCDALEEMSMVDCKTHRLENQQRYKTS